MGRRTKAIRQLKALQFVACLGWLLPSAHANEFPTIPSSEVVLHALTLVDTPYRYGGRALSGFDCSGFVGYVFGESLGLALPRRSEDIYRIGRALERNELAPGDLVFFNTLGRRYSHVGIYIGEGRFVHAPARRGRVRVEQLTDTYWASRFNGAQRIEGIRPSQVATALATPTPSAAVESTLELRITP
jgi:hypothetical protein